MLAKKGTRIITVGGKRYRWRSQDHQVLVQAEEGGQRLRAHLDPGNFISPRLIHRLIERGPQLGWTPSEASKELVLTIQGVVSARAAPHLDAILNALRTDRRKDALVAALNGWLSTRIPELAEFVEHVAESLRDPTLRHDERSWSDELNANQPLTQEALDFMFDADPAITARRARRLTRGRPHDPRVARHLYRGLIAPLHLYHGARDLLETAIDIIATSRDHTLLGALRSGGGVALLARHAGGRKKWFEARAARAIDLLEQSFPLGEPYLIGTEPALEAIRIQLGIAIPTVPHGAAEMLAAIYADPKDDELRRVYADLLLESGDPRGEMIHLQLEQQLIDEGTARMTELLALHSDRWLGTLSGWVALATLERGFPARVLLAYRIFAEDFFPDSAWSTIEEIALPFRNVDTDQLRDRVRRLLGSPHLAALTSLRNASVDTVETIAPLQLRLERLHLMAINQLDGHPEACDRLLLALDRGFPRLKRLELTGWPQDQVERLQRAFGARMEISAV